MNDLFSRKQMKLRAALTTRAPLHNAFRITVSPDVSLDTLRVFKAAFDKIEDHRSVYNHPGVVAR
jgi:hypothetical protein